ncbi:MAG TPA: hypothetical protein VMR77_00640 [Patescibacteria group bacterium]|jgi:hypothetical protein|nr:hypothetical protein [Patescibacteria group bacterium]
MAKKKVLKKKTTGVRKTKRDNGIGVNFHSWTFFLFLLFVLITVLILVAQQMGMRFF